MRIGSSIGLIAVGLILALAVNIDVRGIDLDLIGWILAGVGVVGLVISLGMMRRTRPVAVREETYRSAVGPDDLPPADPRYRDPNARY